MTNVLEKRDNRRIDIQLPLDYQPEKSAWSSSRHTVTLNVSTGGAYFETALDDMNIGDRLSLSFGVGSQDNLFSPDGKITTLGQVVRIQPREDEFTEDQVFLTRYGVGIKFLRPLKLSL